MKPTVQTRVGDDGNCLAACLASIFEIPLRQVPEFSDDSWLQELNDWLSDRGLSYRRVPVDGRVPVGYSTIEGISPRGGLHACVAKDGKLVFDPHPQDGTGRGLVEPRYYGILEPLLGRTAIGDSVNQPMAEVRSIIRGWSFADATGIQRRITKVEDFVRISRLSSTQRRSIETLLQPLRDATREMRGDE